MAPIEQLQYSRKEKVRLFKPDEAIIASAPDDYRLQWHLWRFMRI